MRVGGRIAGEPLEGLLVGAPVRAVEEFVEGLLEGPDVLLAESAALQVLRVHAPDPEGEALDDRERGRVVVHAGEPWQADLAGLFEKWKAEK